MKRKIIAILCLAAMCINMAVIAAEDNEISAPAEVAVNETVTENFEISKNSEEINETEKTEETENNADILIDDLEIIQDTQQNIFADKIENNENSDKLTNEMNVLTAEDKKEELKNLLDEIKECNPGDVASEESMAVLNAAVTEAEQIYADSSADEQTILEAIEKIKSAVGNMEYVKGQSILTNNTFSSAEQTEYYPEMTGDNPTLTMTETSAEYEYDKSSPEGFMTLDSKAERLSNGIANGRITVDNTSAAVIVYNLGAEYFINGIDVFSQFIYLGADPRYRKNIKGFEAEISSDGVNYRKIVSAAAKTELDEGESRGNYVLKTSGDFPASSGQYVRITVTGDDNSTQYNLIEMVIKGFKSPFSRDELYEALVKYADVDSSVHTAQSYSAYIKAYNDAQSVYWDAESSGREIYNAKIALEQAYAALEKNAVIKILSGNVVSEFDRKYYSDYKLDTVDLSYSYLEGSNPQIVSQDKNCNILLQGGYDSLTSSNMTYGTWDNANPAKILFDMGEECYVSGVDVWEYYQGRLTNNMASTRAGWVRISVSSDGKNFSQVSEIYNPKTDEDYQVANVIGQDFDAVKCRYVLVVVEKGTTSHQITLNEVVLRGYRTAAKASDPYMFGTFDYKNASDVRITQIDGNDIIKVSGSVKSGIGQSSSAVVVSVIYKNNDIIDWSFSKVDTEAYGTADFENILNADGKTGIELYTFVWDSLENGLAMSRQKKFGTL